MDKEGMKKYFGYIGKFTGYAGLGLVGGYLGFTLLLIIREGVQGIILPIVFYFFGLVGGKCLLSCYQYIC